MKKTVRLLLLFLILLGCEKEDKLTLGVLEVSNEDCPECPKVNINIPEALDDSPIAETVNTSLREEVISLLSFDEEMAVDSISQAMDSFTAGYVSLKEKFNDEVPWEATIGGDVVFENIHMLTIKVNAYIFTGGAHGYNSVSFLNFDKTKAMELESWELLEDKNGFSHFAETKFRIQEDIPQDANINATGFMFDGDKFHLAENMGYTQNGIQLIYNEYEVASYADGPIVLTIPFTEINMYLNYPIVQ